MVGWEDDSLRIYKEEKNEKFPINEHDLCVYNVIAGINGVGDHIFLRRF